MIKALHEHTIDEIGLMFRRRNLSVPELVRHFLDRIDRYDNTVRAFSSLMFDHAMAQADAAQERYSGDAQLQLALFSVTDGDNYCIRNRRRALSTDSFCCTSGGSAPIQ